MLCHNNLQKFKNNQQPISIYKSIHNNMLPKYLTSTTTTILVGTALRILLILYIAQYQSISAQQLSGTDIDYKVYTDASLYSSPYHRHTYRYSPLLSYMMKYNSVLQYSGKLIFVIFDILSMLALILISREGYQSSILKLYAYNPLFIYLTARGSCQSIATAMMLWCFYFIFQNNGNTVFQNILNRNSKYQDKRQALFVGVGYAIYGLWVHFRVYPILLLPVILIHQYKLCKKSSDAKVTKNVAVSFMGKFIKIGLISGGTFLSLLAIFYHLYGYEFIYQTYLYHLTRLDNRHSFSPIFYQIYLSLNTQSFIRSMAQICVILAVTRRTHESLSPYYAHFIITYAFVSFNKVITMQYYMWVFTALVLVLPESTLLTSPYRRFQKAFSYIMQWMLGILLWVWLSMRLERDGENVFNLMWFVCVGKLFSDIWAVTGFMSTVRNKQAYQALPGEESALLKNIRRTEKSIKGKN